MLTANPSAPTSEENCPICHEAINTEEDSVSLHKSGKSYDHRLHLECLHEYYAKFRPGSNSATKCPLCQDPIDPGVITHYAHPATALAAYIRNDGVALSNHLRSRFVSGCCLKTFSLHFTTHVKKENAVLERLQAVIRFFPIFFNVTEEVRSSQCFNILYHASKLFPFEDFLDFNWEDWATIFVDFVKMSLQQPYEFYRIEDARNFFNAVSAYMKSKRFVSADMWKLACAHRIPFILGILLPHTIPSCFSDGMTGIDVALGDGDLILLKGFMDIDEKSTIDSLRLIISSPNFNQISRDCSRRSTKEIIDFLLENGFTTDQLFKIRAIFEEVNYDAVIYLMKKGLCLAKYFVETNGRHFRELKSLLKSSNSVYGLKEAVDLCLVVLGSLFYPERARWLHVKYREFDFFQEEFNDRIDFVSDSFICRQVTKILENLIHGSWSSLVNLEVTLRDYGVVDIARIYRFDICKNIPFLSPDDLKLAEKNHEGLLELLGAMKIPTHIDPPDALKIIIKRGNKDSLVKYLDENQLNHFNVERAIDVALANGNSESVKLLLSHMKAKVSPDIESEEEESSDISDSDYSN